MLELVRWRTIDKGKSISHTFRFRLAPFVRVKHISISLAQSASMVPGACIHSFAFPSWDYFIKYIHMNITAWMDGRLCVCVCGLERVYGILVSLVCELKTCARTTSRRTHFVASFVSFFYIFFYYVFYSFALFLLDQQSKWQIWNILGLRKIIGHLCTMQDNAHIHTTTHCRTTTCALARIKYFSATAGTERDSEEARRRGGERSVNRAQASVISNGKRFISSIVILLYFLVFFLAPECIIIIVNFVSIAMLLQYVRCSCSVFAACTELFAVATLFIYFQWSLFNGKC